MGHRIVRRAHRRLWCRLAGCLCLLSGALGSCGDPQEAPMPAIVEIRVAENTAEADLEKGGTFVYRVEVRSTDEEVLDWLVRGSDPRNEPEVLTLADGFTFDVWQDDDLFTLRLESLAGAFPEVWSVSFMSVTVVEGEVGGRVFRTSECIDCPPPPTF